MVLVFLDRRKISQADLAKGAKVPESTISAILAGRRGISKANARAFATYFGVPTDRFLVG